MVNKIVLNLHGCWLLGFRGQSLQSLDSAKCLAKCDFPRRPCIQLCLRDELNFDDSLNPKDVAADTIANVFLVQNVPCDFALVFDQIRDGGSLSAGNNVLSSPPACTGTAPV